VDVTTIASDDAVKLIPVTRISHVFPGSIVSAPFPVTVTAACPFSVTHLEPMSRPDHAAVPAVTIIVSPLEAAVMQAAVSVCDAEAVVHVGDEPEQAALADGEQSAAQNARITIIFFI
jgi:hypothetical protein